MAARAAMHWWRALDGLRTEGDGEIFEVTRERMKQQMRSTNEESWALWDEAKPWSPSKAMVPMVPI